MKKKLLFLNLNKKILNINNELNLKIIYQISTLKNIIEQNFDKLDNLNLDYKETQIFKKIKQIMNCDRHFKVFNEYKIIPKFCFNCYKIQITCNNVIDLIKLFFFFNNLNLKNNNIRKCIVELRNNVLETIRDIYFVLA